VAAAAAAARYDASMSLETTTAGARAAEPDSAELEALLSRCASKDSAAFAVLYEGVSPLLLAVLLRMLRRRDLAEDVLQDVFVKVWERAGEFDRIRGRPLAWLVAIARYRAIDLKRGTRPTIVLTDVGADAEPALQVEDPGDTSDWRGMRAALQRCLELIAAPQRRCLVLAYQGGLTHEEISRTVGEPLGTVKSWVRRSLQNLRRCLES